jgi:hypothetical protein
MREVAAEVQVIGTQRPEMSFRAAVYVRHQPEKDSPKYASEGAAANADKRGLLVLAIRPRR